MSFSRERPSRWAAIGPAALIEVLAPLRDEHVRRGEARLVARRNGQPLHQAVAELACDQTTILILEDPAEPSLRGTVPMPLLGNAVGADASVGWLQLDAQELSAYVRRAVALLQRPSASRLPVALFGPREQRYVDLLDHLVLAAEPTSELVLFNWGAERLARHRLGAAMRQGAAAAIYTGHGNAHGWLAYGGGGVDALIGGPAPTDDEAIGVLFSLACRTGQSSDGGDSGSAPPPRGCADDVVRRGLAGAVLAPVTAPLHEHNRTLAAAIVRAIGSGRRTCGDVVRASQDQGACLEGYAIIGDPATPVAAAAGALERCRGVFAPAPDAVLTPYSLPAALPSDAVRTGFTHAVPGAAMPVRGAILA